jgi:dihydrofolate reductase
MRKLIVDTFMTLDGIMQAPGGPEEDPNGGFEHGGWAFGYWDDVVDETLHRRMADPFDLLLGRKTYEIFAAHWPTTRSRPPRRSTTRPSTSPPRR